MIDYNKLIQWAFYGVVGGSCVALVSILKHLLITQIEMNSKINVIMEKDEWYQQWLKRHDRELKELRSRI